MFVFIKPWMIHRLCFPTAYSFHIGCVPTLSHPLRSSTVQRELVTVYGHWEAAHIKDKAEFQGGRWKDTQPRCIHCWPKSLFESALFESDQNHLHIHRSIIGNWLRCHSSSCRTTCFCHGIFWPCILDGSRINGYKVNYPIIVISFSIVLFFVGRNIYIYIYNSKENVRVDIPCNHEVWVFWDLQENLKRPTPSRWIIEETCRQTIVWAHATDPHGDRYWKVAIPRIASRQYGFALLTLPSLRS